MTSMPTDLMIGLKEIFATYFDLEGLTDLALALGVDIENLSGASKSAKARELALYLRRHSKLPLLAEVGPAQRPDIDWSLLAPYAPDLPEPAAALALQPIKLDFRDLQKLAPVVAAYPKLSHRYYKLKAKWLGLDKLQVWDRNAPLPTEATRTVGWDEARKTVSDAYHAVSPALADRLVPFFDRPWIEARVKA